MAPTFVQATIPTWLVRPSEEKPRPEQLVSDKDEGDARSLVPGMRIVFPGVGLALIDGKVSFVVEDTKPHREPELARRSIDWRVWTSLTVKLDGATIWQGGENWHVKDHYHIASFSRQVALDEREQHLLEVFAIYARKGADDEETLVWFKECVHHHLSVIVLPR